MGRYYWDEKDTVGESTELSIYKLKEFGLLVGICSATITWTSSFSGHQSSVGIYVNVIDKPIHIKLNYKVTDRGSGEKTDYDYKVQLTTTPCNFGGIRYWFICPLSRNSVYYGRRVGTLDLAPGGNYFGCRHCYNLSYESRNEPRLARFGGIGCPIKTERQYEDLYKQIKRWTYKGKSTRKTQKLQALERRLDMAVSVCKVHFRL